MPSESSITIIPFEGLDNITRESDAPTTSANSTDTLDSARNRDGGRSASCHDAIDRAVGAEEPVGRVSRTPVEAWSPPGSAHGESPRTRNGINGRYRSDQNGFPEVSNGESPQTSGRNNKNTHADEQWQHANNKARAVGAMRRRKSRFQVAVGAVKTAPSGLISFVVLSIWMPVFTWLFTLYEPWSGWEAWIFTGTICSTIGYGNMPPRSDEGKVLVILCGLLGIPLMINSLAWIGSLMAWVLWEEAPKHLNKLGRRLGKLRQRSFGRGAGRGASKEVHVAKHTRLLGTGVITLVYLLHVVAVYQHMEGWTFLNAVYYTFCCCATIGLGDFVPVLEGGKAGSPALWYQVWHTAVVLGGLTLFAMIIRISAERIDRADQIIRKASPGRAVTNQVNKFGKKLKRVEYMRRVRGIVRRKSFKRESPGLYELSEVDRGANREPRQSDFTRRVSL